MMQRPIPLHHKVTLITGASSGIGRAAAHAFAARGARLVLASRRLDALKAVQSELGCFQVPVLVVPVDISVETDLQDLVARARQAFGRIDILVNNAGTCRGGLFQDMDPEILSEVMLVNLFGTLRLTRLVLPFMLAQGAGHIVNVSSLSAKFYIPGVSVYSATKAGIQAFSDTLRREVSSRGIHISTVLGGPTRTGMIASAIEQVFQMNGNHRHQFLKRLVRFVDEPEVVARAILLAVQYRRRQLMTGGSFVRLVSGLETLTPRLLDRTLSRVDMQKIDVVTRRLGQE